MIEWKMKGLFNADAEKVYSEIKDLGESFGPQDIVNAATNETSELHKCFTWDDTEAAAKWRKQEARILVANIVVKVETGDNEKVNIRVIESTNRNEYKPTSVIVQIPEDYAALLARAKAELNSFKVKYHNVKELRNVFEAIDEL